MGPRTIFWSRLLVGIGLTLGCAAVSVAQDTSYVLVPGIAGESVDAAHPGWIEAYGLNHVSTSSGGAPVHDKIAVLKGTDTSTPQLFDRLSRGSDLGIVTIEVCRNPAGGGGQECYYKLTLQSAKITDISVSGSSCIDPTTSCTPAQTESVQFTFSKITWTYYGFSQGKSSCSCWDVAKGGPCSCSP